MRRALRMTWHGLAVVLAIAIVSLAILELPGFDFRFHRHGQAWQFTCTQGVLHLGNAPQMKLEAERSEAARDARNRINEARETPLREILRHEVWRSQAYQVAMIKLNELREVEADQTLRAIEKENALGSPAIEHSVQISRLILPALAILSLWVAIQSFCWARRLGRAGWTGRQLAATGLTSLSAFLFFALAYLWMRSNYVVDDLFYSSHQRQGAEYRLTLFSAEGGNFHLHHYEEKLFESQIVQTGHGTIAKRCHRPRAFPEERLELSIILDRTPALRRIAVLAPIEVFIGLWKFEPTTPDPRTLGLADHPVDWRHDSDLAFHAPLCARAGIVASQNAPAHLRRA